MSQILKINIFRKQMTFGGGVQKCVLERLGLSRTDSDPKYIIMMRGSPLGLIAQVYIQFPIDPYRSLIQFPI